MSWLDSILSYLSPRKDFEKAYDSYDEEQEESVLDKYIRRAKDVYLPAALGTAEEMLQVPQEAQARLQGASARNLFGIPHEGPLRAEEVVPSALFPTEEEGETLPSKLLKASPGGSLLESPQVNAVARGASRPLAALATDPTLAASMGGRIPSALIGGYFGVKGAQGAGEEIGTGLSELEGGDLPTALEHLGGGAANLGVAGLGVKGAVHGLRGEGNPVRRVGGELLPDVTPGLDAGPFDLSSLDNFESNAVKSHGENWRMTAPKELITAHNDLISKVNKNYHEDVPVEAPEVKQEPYTVDQLNDQIEYLQIDMDSFQDIAGEYLNSRNHDLYGKLSDDGDQFRGSGHLDEGIPEGIKKNLDQFHESRKLWEQKVKERDALKKEQPIEAPEVEDKDLIKYRLDSATRDMERWGDRMTEDPTRDTYKELYDEAVEKRNRLLHQFKGERYEITTRPSSGTPYNPAELGFEHSQGVIGKADFPHQYKVGKELLEQTIPVRSVKEGLEGILETESGGPENFTLTEMESLREKGYRVDPELIAGDRVRNTSILPLGEQGKRGVLDPVQLTKGQEEHQKIIKGPNGPLISELPAVYFGDSHAPQEIAAFHQLSETAPLHEVAKIFSSMVDNVTGNLGRFTDLPEGSVTRFAGFGRLGDNTGAYNRPRWGMETHPEKIGINEGNYGVHLDPVESIKHVQNWVRTKKIKPEDASIAWFQHLKSIAAHEVAHSDAEAVHGTGDAKFGETVANLTEAAMKGHDPVADYFLRTPNGRAELDRIYNGVRDQVDNFNQISRGGFPNRHERKGPDLRELRKEFDTERYVSDVLGEKSSIGTTPSDGIDVSAMHSKGTGFLTGETREKNGRKYVQVRTEGYLDSGEPLLDWVPEDVVKTWPSKNKSDSPIGTTPKENFTNNLTESLKSSGITKEIAKRADQLIKEEGFDWKKAVRVAKAEASEGLLPESTSNALVSPLEASKSESGTPVPPKKSSNQGELPVSTPEGIEQELLSTGLMTPEELQVPGLRHVPSLDNIEMTNDITTEQLDRGKRNVGRPKKSTQETVTSGDSGQPPKPPKPPKKGKGEGEGEVPKVPKSREEAITDADSFFEGWRKLRTTSDKIRELFNIHRALRSSGDTPVLRQGRIISFNNPVIAFRAAKEMTKSVISKEHYDTLNSEIAKDPTVTKFAAEGAEYVPDFAGITGLREESFPSPLAEKIPGFGKYLIAPSDRAYTSFMNSAKLGYWKKHIKNLEKSGMTLESNPKDFKDLARVTNMITFRGDTNNTIVKELAHSPTAGAMFYSPRNKASQVQLMRHLLLPSDLTSYNSKLLRKNLTQTFAINAAIYGGLAYAGIGTMESDPESSDFLKLKVGERRYNPWMGMNQIVRAAVLASTGRTKSLAGKQYRTTPEEVFGRFVRSSLAPTPGMMLTLFTGTNPAGTKVRDSADNIEKQIFDTAVYMFTNEIGPLNAKDIVDEWRASGAASAIATVAIPGAMGENVAVYEPREEKPKAKTKSKTKSKYKYAY